MAAAAALQALHAYLGVSEEGVAQLVDMGRSLRGGSSGCGGDAGLDEDTSAVDAVMALMCHPEAATLRHNVVVRHANNSGQRLVPATAVALGGGPIVAGVSRATVRLADTDDDVGALQTRLALAEAAVAAAVAELRARPPRMRASGPGDRGGAAGGSDDDVGGGAHTKHGSYPSDVDYAVLPPFADVAALAAADPRFRADLHQLLVDLTLPSAVMLDAKHIGARLYRLLVARDRAALLTSQRLDEVLGAAAVLEGCVALRAALDAAACSVLIRAGSGSPPPAVVAGHAAASLGVPALAALARSLDASCRTVGADALQLPSAPPLDELHMRARFAATFPWGIQFDVDAASSLPGADDAVHLHVPLPLAALRALLAARDALSLQPASISAARLTSIDGAAPVIAPTLPAAAAAASTTATAAAPASTASAAAPLVSSAAAPSNPPAASAAATSAAATAAAVAAAARGRSASLDSLVAPPSPWFGATGTTREGERRHPRAAEAPSAARERAILKLTHGVDYLQDGRRPGEFLQLPTQRVDDVLPAGITLPQAVRSAAAAPRPPVLADAGVTDGPSSGGSGGGSGGLGIMKPGPPAAVAAAAAAAAAAARRAAAGARQPHILVPADATLDATFVSSASVDAAAVAGDEDGGLGLRASRQNSEAWRLFAVEEAGYPLDASVIALLQELDPALLYARLPGLRVTTVAHASAPAVAAALRPHDVIFGVTRATAAADTAAGAWGSPLAPCAAGACTAPHGVPPPATPVDGRAQPLLLPACAGNGGTLPPLLCSPAAGVAGWDSTTLWAALAAAADAAEAAGTSPTAPAVVLHVARPTLLVRLEAALRGMPVGTAVATSWPVPRASPSGTSSGGGHHHHHGHGHGHSHGHTHGHGHGHGHGHAPHRHGGHGAAGLQAHLVSALAGTHVTIPGASFFMGAEESSLDEAAVADHDTGQYLGYAPSGYTRIDSELKPWLRRPPLLVPAPLMLRAVGGGAGESGTMVRSRSGGSSSGGGGSVGGAAHAATADAAGVVVGVSESAGDQGQGAARAGGGGAPPATGDDPAVAPSAAAGALPAPSPSARVERGRKVPAPVAHMPTVAVTWSRGVAGFLAALAATATAGAPPPAAASAASDAEAPPAPPPASAPLVFPDVAPRDILVAALRAEHRLARLHSAVIAAASAAQAVTNTYARPAAGAGGGENEAMGRPEVQVGDGAGGAALTGGNGNGSDAAAAAAAAAAAEGGDDMCDSASVNSATLLEGLDPTAAAVLLQSPTELSGGELTASGGTAPTGGTYDYFFVSGVASSPVPSPDASPTAAGSSLATAPPALVLSAGTGGVADTVVGRRRRARPVLTPALPPHSLKVTLRQLTSPALRRLAELAGLPLNGDKPALIGPLVALLAGGPPPPPPPGPAAAVTPMIVVSAPPGRTASSGGGGGGGGGASQDGGGMEVDASAPARSSSRSPSPPVAAAAAAAAGTTGTAAATAARLPTVTPTPAAAGSCGDLVPLPPATLAEVMESSAVAYSNGIILLPPPAPFEAALLRRYHAYPDGLGGLGGLPTPAGAEGGPPAAGRGGGRGRGGVGGGGGGGGRGGGDLHSAAGRLALSAPCTVGTPATPSGGGTTATTRAHGASAARGAG